MNPLKRYVDIEGRGTQARLAKELGLSRTFIGDLVAGRREPNLDLMRRLEAITEGRVAFADWRGDAHSAYLKEAAPKRKPVEKN